MDSRPKYQQVAADLEQRVRSGEYAPGEPLPSLSELGEHYEVSAITARPAGR